MKKKKLLALMLALAMVLSLAACGTSDDKGSDASNSPAANTDNAGTDTPAPADNGSVPNNQKPVIWFNRQPSNSQTGELDMDALTFNDKTYYVGFDAVQGAILQGEMIVEYLQAQGAELDRQGDGIIG